MVHCPPTSRLMDEQPRLDGSIPDTPPHGAACLKCGIVADGDLTWIRNPVSGELEIYCFEPQPCYERAEATS